MEGGRTRQKGQFTLVIEINYVPIRFYGNLIAPSNVLLLSRPSLAMSTIVAIIALIIDPSNPSDEGAQAEHHNHNQSNKINCPSVLFSPCRPSPPSV